MSGGAILGLDVGGTKTAIVVGTGGGQVVQRVEIPSGAGRGFAAMFEDVCVYAAAAIAKFPAIQAIGVSIGGPVDARAGLVEAPPHLPGWDRIQLAEMLRARFGRPAFVEHDAKASALAEHRFGAGQEVEDMVFLTCGTGLGAGIIAGGKLVRGVKNAAGEVGHWRVADDGPERYGKRGSWESFASGGGIAALARMRAPDAFAEGTTARDVAARAAAGDRDAIAIVEESGRGLGRGLALLIDALAPEMIVLGPLARRLGPAWLQAARTVVDDEALPALALRCQIVPSSLGDALGDVASLCPAIEASPTA